MDALFRVAALNLEIFGIDPATPRSTSRSSEWKIIEAETLLLSRRILILFQATFEMYLVGGLEHLAFIFPYIANVIIPTDFHSIIFQRGSNHQPGMILWYFIAKIYQNIKGQGSTPKCPNVPGRSECSRPNCAELRLSWYLLQRFRPAQLGGSWADGCSERAEIVRYIMLNLYI